VIPWLFLAVSLWGAAFTAAALVKARRLRGLAFPYFMGAWLTDELALHHLAWQAPATLVFVAAGALEAAPGRVGLLVTALSWTGLLVAHLRARPAGRALAPALAELGLDLRAQPEVGWRDWWRPFRMRREGIVRVHDVPYRPRDPRDRPGRHLLDVVMPAEPDGGRRPPGGGERALRPALLQVHGGAWVIGDKRQQGLPLMHHLAARGWVCFAQNYRLCPRATFPDPIVDVKRALAWIREHAEEYGVDPGFVCITGGSAGGHLAALAALTAHDPAFQPGFEQADTSVAACVPFYGVYDFLDRHAVRGRQSMRPFLERYVLKCPPGTHREHWESASPLARVHAEAPPFFVLHGSHDSLVFVEEARLFVEALREKSRRPVLYAELPGAQHAFDLFHSLRSAHAVRAVAAFLEHVHLERRREVADGRL
jgi:acetyl esterase/lipase